MKITAQDERMLDLLDAISSPDGEVTISNKELAEMWAGFHGQSVVPTTISMRLVRLHDNGLIHVDRVVQPSGRPGKHVITLGDQAHEFLNSKVSEGKVPGDDEEDEHEQQHDDQRIPAHASVVPAR